MAKKKLSEERGSLDPHGIFSDETYILGMDDSNPERKKLMKKHGLKDNPEEPGVYGSKGRNFNSRHKEHR